MPRRLVIAATALACLFVLTGVLTASARPDGPSARSVRGHVTIATGGITGVYDLYGSKYARLLRTELPGLSVATVTTAGSVDNLERLADGRAQVGFATADTAFYAMSTGSPRPGATPAPSSSAPPARGGKLRAVARIYDEYIHVVVRADSPARTLKDLRGLRVSTGQAGSSTELVAGRLLEAAGLSAERDLVRHRLGINDSVALMRANGLDAFFWSGGLPTPGIEVLAKAQPIRLLPLGKHVDALRARYGTFYRRAVVPAATYGLAQTVTIGVPNYLVVSSSVDAAIVYQLTRVLFERREDLAKDVPSGRLLDARTAISTIPIPLHPGAARYYREHKP